MKALLLSKFRRCFNNYFSFFSPVKSTSISLSGNDWIITNPNYTAQGSVPGTIHTILLAAKQIPDL